MLKGGPAGPDASQTDGAWHQQVDADRAALWDALGGIQGVLDGFTLSVVAGQLKVNLAAGSALLQERDASGNPTVARGYHAYATTTTSISFGAPSAAVRVDAVVLAFADTENGALGTGVSQVGPQVIVVPGTSGTATPVPDATITAAVGAGAWMRLADVTINPGDTQIASGNLSVQAVYLPRTLVQSGVLNIQLTAQNTNTATVTFPIAFGTGPIVTAISALNKVGVNIYTAPTATQVGFRVWTADGSNATETVTVYWIAAGKRP